MTIILEEGKEIYKAANGKLKKSKWKNNKLVKMNKKKLRKDKNNK